MTTRSDAPGGSTARLVLAAEELCKSYGPRPALRGLSFKLRAGRIMGLLGPNGAGKTTSIRILTTIMEPDSGRFMVDGISWRHPDEIRRRIGVLPESFGLPRQTTGIEYLTFFGQLYGQTARDARSRARSLLEDVGLASRARSLVDTYSHGMRQRIGIARALINDPGVVFLDEPTLGLDPAGQEELLGIVRRIAEERHAGVVLCSHLLGEVESVCDDVVILRSGRVAAKGTVSQVIGGTERNVVRIRVPEPSVGESHRTLAAVPTVTSVVASDAVGWLRLELDKPAAGNGKVNNQILEALIRAGIPILGFEPEGGRLHDAFLHLTAGGLE